MAQWVKVFTFNPDNPRLTQGPHAGRRDWALVRYPVISYVHRGRHAPTHKQFDENVI